MEDKPFIWSPQLSKKLFKLKFENNWLFERSKQPWFKFHKILQEKGFPEEMTVNHVRKKWAYHMGQYRIAKRTNKRCNYFKMFDKHYGKIKVLDKYSSWHDEWRLKLIKCMSDINEQNPSMEHQNMWRAIEKIMRSQDLPEDCCVHDMKGLWQYMKVTFVRKYRMALRKSNEASSWPLYDAMLEYFTKHEPEELAQCQPPEFVLRHAHLMKKGKELSVNRKRVDGNDNENEFHWTRHITESFIQIRLQNDWLFKEKPQAWKTFYAILQKECGFPSNVTVNEIRKKWTSTYADWQKSKATNNTGWIYYNLFELYLGEGSLTLNPMLDWRDEWVFSLIKVRTDLEPEFRYHHKYPTLAWRLVEKRLRTMGLPLTHCLLDLPQNWAYLCRTFKWKRKFAIKGTLTEKWPFYDLMARYYEVHDKQKIKLQTINNDERDKTESYEHDEDTVGCDDDLEDDIKLFDLKQQMEMQVKPKHEIESKCRTCASVETYLQCVDIFDYRDDDGTDLVSKLKAVGGIEVEKSDSLTTQICYNCVQELQSAYKFRLKCQNADRALREAHAQMQNIKTELLDIQFEDKYADHDDMDRSEDIVHIDETNKAKQINNTLLFPSGVKKETVRKRRVANKRYTYTQICEICGKSSRNLKSHLDTHNTARLYSCEVCDKKFKFKSGLILHKLSHNPVPRKTCEVCGKTFQIMAQYRRHYAYHANERKFECETCGKRFNSMDILKIHLRMHTDERNFSCSECGKSFRTAGCVSRHKRIVHRSVKKIE